MLLSGGKQYGAVSEKENKAALMFVKLLGVAAILYGGLSVFQAGMESGRYCVRIDGMAEFDRDAPSCKAIIYNVERL